MAEIRVSRVRPDAVIPEFATAGSAGFDLTACEDTFVDVGTIALVPTGLVIDTPDDNMLLIASRSSTPRKFGLTMPHGVGVVDSDYCGPEDEILIQVYNYTDTPITILKGDRIAQGIIVPVLCGKRVQFVESELVGTSRGGFGSTDAVKH